MALFDSNIESKTGSDFEINLSNSNSIMSIITDSNQLFNMLFKINSKDLIYLNTHNIPVSNKYYITVVDKFNGEIADFLKYIFDDTREIQQNFIPDLDTDTNLKWDLEQFYFVELGKGNLITLENDLDEVKSIIQDSNGETVLLIDINYLIDYLTICDKENIPVHIYDFLLLKFKQFNFEKILIFDGENKYSKNNMLYKQIGLFLDPENIILQKLLNSESDSESDSNSNQIHVYKKFQDNDYNIIWKIAMSDDLVIKTKVVDTTVTTGIKFYFGKVNHVESFISKIKISEIIRKNIFELDDNPGIIVDPIDKINFILS